MSILVSYPARRVGVLVLSCLFISCRATEKPPNAPALTAEGEVRIAPDSPKNASLGIDTVRLVSERSIATLPAQVVPDEDHTVRVLSPVVGRIVTLLAQPGDRVRSGQPLALLRSSDAAQFTSDLAKARATYESTHAALMRATDLYEHKVVALRDLEQARNDEAQARAELGRARARNAQLGLGGGAVSDAYVLRAPVAGVVIDRSANPGGEVRPDNGQALFTISALNVVWLAVTVPQRDVALVHRGARLRFHSDANPGQRFDGRVSFVSDALDPTSRTATARAVLDNGGEALKLHTAGDVELLVAEPTPAPTIPSRALITHGTSTVVFVEVSPGRFVRRVVTVRDDDGSTATIASGVKAGERVVTTGSLLLAAEADRDH
jgi:cobalt-zinc-cadmium efflux system membrane fusion protein